MATIDMKTLKFENDENTYKVVDGDAVHISAQTLSDIEKTQVLNNIGAAAAEHSHTLSSLGAAAASHTHNSFEALPSGVITLENDTVANWGALKNGVSNYGSAATLTDKPNTYGLVLNLTNGFQEVHQLFLSQPNGHIFHRGGNNSGWYGSWKAIHDTGSVLYSSTEPTGRFVGQLWLKPI